MQKDERSQIESLEWRIEIMETLVYLENLDLKFDGTNQCGKRTFLRFNYMSLIVQDNAKMFIAKFEKVL